MRTLTRDRRPLVWFQCVWVTENVCRFLAGFGRVLADGVTARVVFMQDRFHAELSSCKIVFMQDCLHARLFPCKIAFMQDFMQHAGGFLCIFTKLEAKSTPEAPKSTPEAPKSTPEAPQIHPGSSPETKFS